MSTFFDMSRKVEMSQPHPIIGDMDELVAIATALGDPLRVRILDVLAKGRSLPCCSPEHPDAPVWVCACDIARELGGLAHSKLAYHLGLLRAAGLVQEQRRAKWVYYAINEEALAAFTRHLGSRWRGDAPPPPPPPPEPPRPCCIPGFRRAPKP